MRLGVQKMKSRNKFEPMEWAAIFSGRHTPDVDDSRKKNNNNNNNNTKTKFKCPRVGGSVLLK